MSQTEVQLIKDAVIVNADVSNSAAIDVSKISGAMPTAGGAFTDDVTFTGASANIFFDKSANTLDFLDGAFAAFGNARDLRVYHDGTDSFVQDQGTGNLLLITDGTAVKIQKGVSETMAGFNVDGAAELYFDNAKKLETKSNGVEIQGHLSLADNNEIRLGNVGSNGDTRITHVAGSHTEINHVGTGDLILETVNGGDDIMLDSNDDIFLNHAGESMIVCRSDAQVELYHDNTKKFETTTDGVNLAGNNLQFQGQSNRVIKYRPGDNDMIYEGDAGDFYRQNLNDNRHEFFVGNTKKISVTGNGLTFNADTAAANSLNDFEEGTWTPVYHSGVTSQGTYSNTSGNYIKIGNLVTFTARLQMSGSDANFHHVIINGLPFTSDGTKKEGGVSIGYGQALNQNNTSGKPTGHIPQNSSAISFYEPSGGALYANNSTFVNLDETLHIRGFYYT